MDLPLWIEEIKNRADKATPGPWDADVGGDADRVYCGPDWVSECSTSENALFIAHARTDMPRLVAVARQMADALDEASAVLDLIRIDDAPVCDAKLQEQAQEVFATVLEALQTWEGD